MLARTTRAGRYALAVVFGLSPLLGAAVAPGQTIDFDALPSGEVVTRIAPVAFGHSAPGIDLVVSTGAPTTSMDHYLGAAYLLGASNDVQDLFLPGERLVLSFASPIRTISLAVISTPGTPAGAFELVTPSGSVVSGGSPDQLAGEDEIFLLSFTSSTPFGEAELRSSYADGLFAFHVDDVTVPEPGMPSLIGTGIGLLSLLGGRRARSRTDSA